MGQPETAAACASRHLEAIMEREPLYKPARFALALLHLRQGNTSKAESLFIHLITPYERNAEQLLVKALTEFPGSGLKYLYLFKIGPIRRKLQPWADEWRYISTLVLGSDLYIATELWAEFDERVAESTKTDLHRELLLRHLEVYPRLGGIENLAKRAAGEDPKEAEKAHEILDNLLNKTTIRDLDLLLQRLETDCEIANSPVLTDARKTPSMSRLAALKDNSVVKALPYLKAIVDELTGCWEMENWGRCKRLLRDLRERTRKPSIHEAIAKVRLTPLRNMAGDTVWSSKLEYEIVKFVFPGFASLDAWRDTFQNGFYLESAYYHALCCYQSFTIEGFEKARREAEELHSRTLAGSVPPGIDAQRYAELRILAQCLEALAVYQILTLDETEPEVENAQLPASVRDWELQKEIVPALRKLVDKHRFEPATRATIAVMLGLMERHKRRQWAKTTIETGKSPEYIEAEKELAKFRGKDRVSEILAKHPEKAVAELVWHRRSLNFARSADACFYMAETLFETGRAEEAKDHLDEARRLCPGHAGVSRLYDEKMKVPLAADD